MCSATSYSTPTATSCAVRASRSTSKPRCSTCWRSSSRNRHRVVPKTELLDTVWGDRFVGERTSAVASRRLARPWATTDQPRRSSAPSTGVATGSSPTCGVAAGEPRSRLGRRVRPPPDQVIRLHHLGRSAARVRHGRPRPAARPRRPLDHAPRLRLAQPGVAPLARGALPTAGRWYATTSGGAGSRITTSRSGRSTPSSTTSRRWWTTSGSSGSRCSGVSQGGAGRHRLRRPAPRAREPARHHRLLRAGQRRRARTDEERHEADLQVEIARVGWGHDDPTFRRFFTSSFIPDASPSCRTPSPSCCAAPRRPRTPPACWRRGPRST